MSTIKIILKYLYLIFQRIFKKYKAYKVKMGDKKIGRAKFFGNIVLWWIIIIMGWRLLNRIGAINSDYILRFSHYTSINIILFIVFPIWRFILIKRRCRDIGYATGQAIFYFFPFFPIILFFIQSKDKENENKKTLKQRICENKKFIVVIMIGLGILASLLSINDSIRKQSNFENENKCQEYFKDFESNLINQTSDLYEYKYGEKISDENVLKTKMQPYGIFYSTKHNGCMKYFNYDKMLTIQPYNATRDDAGYYAWFCPGILDTDDCYYFYNKSYDELLANDIFQKYWNDNYTKVLYFDLYLDSKIWKENKMDWLMTFDDFWYTISKLGIYKTESREGFLAHYSPYLALFGTIGLFLLQIPWLISLWICMIIMCFVYNVVCFLLSKLGIIKNKKMIKSKKKVESKRVKK